MTCDKCAYAMDAWDKVCPRCGGKGPAKPAANVATNKAPSQATNHAVSTSIPQNVAQAVADVKMTTSQADKYASIDRNIDLWWEGIAGGIFLLLCSVGSYYYFTSWEASGGIRRMRWWLALAYSIGGKWPIIIVFALLGLAGIGLGVSDYLDLRRKNLI